MRTSLDKSVVILQFARELKAIKYKVTKRFAEDGVTTPEK